MARTVFFKIQMGSFTGLSGQFSQYVPVLPHDRLRRIHLLREIGIVGRDLHTVEGVHHEEGIPLFDSEFGQQLLFDMESSGTKQIRLSIHLLCVRIAVVCS